MNGIGLDALTAEISAIQAVHPVGRISTLGGGIVTVTGLSDCAALGDLVSLPDGHGQSMLGEVLTLSPSSITILPDGNAEGMQIGDHVILLGQNSIAPHDSWIGRVIDPFGQALDGGAMLRGNSPRLLRGQPLNPTCLLYTSPSPRD